MLDNAISILEKLVGFPSISGRSTDAIVSYIKDYLESHGADVSLSYDAAGERANIFATIGPHIDGGVVLSGHTDVVPVEGQAWSSDPFVLRQSGDRLYGRGSVDMKGFLACMMAMVPVLKAADLQKPVHLAFAYDEEAGGTGMPGLLRDIADKPYRPEIIIEGEPTEMTIITGHKGGDELRTEITGFEAHSCDPTRGVNAISAAMKLIAKIEEIGARLAADPVAGSPFQPPYGTFNIGTIEGGTARNATAGWCNFDWETRPMPGQDSAPLLQEILDYVENTLLPPMKAIHPNADIRIITEVSMPPLDDRNAEKAATFVASITGSNILDVVSFGTDAGYYSDAGYSAVVCGPGTIKRAHAPDEYITTGELQAGLDFIQKIADKLSGQ